MKMSRSGDDNKVEIFEFELKWHVARPSNNEFSLPIDEIVDTDKYMKEMSKTADLVARYVTQEFSCECLPLKSCIIQEAGNCVGRLGLEVVKQQEAFLINPIQDFVNRFLQDLAIMPVSCEKDKYTKDQNLIFQVHKEFQKLSSGHESINVTLKYPNNKVVELIISPKGKKVEETRTEFDGHVWCVDDHTHACGIQAGEQGRQGKSMRISYNPTQREHLLEYQLYRSTLHFKIERYDKRGQLDGKLLSADPVQKSCLD